MNTSVFRTMPGALVPPTDTTNNAGGTAYERSPQEVLAQFAATGCFGHTFYVKAEDQLTHLLDAAKLCDDEWITRCAIYSRRAGLMKDMPAVLCAVLAARQSPRLEEAFKACIDNAKMVRNFVQVVRSGVTGRKSFGSRVRGLIRGWINSRTDEQLFHASIGDKPSLADIIKMVHPKPKDDRRRAIVNYILGRQVESSSMLPECVQQFEAAKKDPAAPLPDLNFQFLSSLPLTSEQWGTVCDRASWQTLRMNLNTFHRHGCFADAERLSRVIERLRNREEIAAAKPMPYQLFAAYMNVGDDIPPGIKMALAQAVEIALENIPAMPANTVVAVDVSGSMRSAITGEREVSSVMRCVDVAALFACAILRRCPTAKVIAFDKTLHSTALAGSVVDSAAILARFGGGGTNCSLPIQWCATEAKALDALVLISDNESWMDSRGAFSGTASMGAWRLVQSRFPKAKLACIDLTPNTTKQVVGEPSILSVGGFSDAVFDVLGAFLHEGRSWRDVVSAVDLAVAG